MRYYPSNTMLKMRQHGTNAVHVFRKTLVKHGKKATSHTASSIRYESDLKGAIASYRIYADVSIIYINQGRPKGAKMPPSIFSRKGRRLDLWFGAKGIPRNKSTDYLIRRKIARDGIKPIPVIDQSIEEIKVISETEIKQAVKKDLLKMGYSMFKNALS